MEKKKYATEVCTGIKTDTQPDWLDFQISLQIFLIRNFSPQAAISMGGTSNTPFFSNSLSS